jgi:hypothetical protein
VRSSAMTLYALHQPSVVDLQCREIHCRTVGEHDIIRCKVPSGFDAREEEGSRLLPYTGTNSNILATSIFYNVLFLNLGFRSLAC